VFVVEALLANDVEETCGKEAGMSSLWRGNSWPKYADLLRQEVCGTCQQP
jgi:hypothetical protein